MEANKRHKDMPNPYAGCALWVAIISICSGIFTYNVNLSDKERKGMEDRALCFGVGEVVEIYGYTSGNVPANRHHHVVAVVENEYGDRIKAHIGDQAAVVGDYYTLKVEKGRNRIVLSLPAEEWKTIVMEVPD